MTSLDGSGSADGPETSGVSRKKRRRKRGRKRWNGQNNTASRRQEDRAGHVDGSPSHDPGAQPPNGAGQAKDERSIAPSSQDKHRTPSSEDRRGASARSRKNKRHAPNSSHGLDARARDSQHQQTSQGTAPHRNGQSDGAGQGPKKRYKNSGNHLSSKNNNRSADRYASAHKKDPGKTLYAALDLGTNNCRLLVARPEERGFRVVDAYSRIVRLGEGVSTSGRLSDQAMDRAIEALKICGRKLQDRGVGRARLIATEACRAAENGPLFIERVREESGLSLEIVTRETEARLAVAGCVSLVDPKADGVVLFDIGGGSSELVWLDLRNSRGARGYALTRFMRAWTSLPVGVVTLAERHGGTDVSFERFEAMIDDVSSHLDQFARGERLAELIAEGGVHMLGTSGTVTTLAGIHLGLKRYDRRQVDGIWLDGDQVSSMINRLRGMSYGERVENPCIGADRADLVLAGCAILEAIHRRWPCQRLRVADRGLREGILTELMSSDGVWRRRRGPSDKQRRRRPGKRNG